MGRSWSLAWYLLEFGLEAVSATLNTWSKHGVGASLTQAGKSINTINVHCTTSTDTLTTTSAESQSWVNLVLDSDQRIQHHRSSLVQIQSIALHAWLVCWFIWIPSVDVEGLDQGVRTWSRFLDSRSIRID